MKIEFEPSKKYREKFGSLPDHIKQCFSSDLVELEEQIKETPGLADLLSQYKDHTLLRDEYILAFRLARKRKEYYVIELLAVYKKKEFKFLYNRFKNFLEKHGEDIWKLIKKLFLDG